jgi:hypothetical protein
MQRVIPQSVLDTVEKLGDFFVGLLGHAVQHLLDQVLLVSTACFNDQLTGGCALDRG